MTSSADPASGGTTAGGRVRPVPREAAVELDRLARRWAELALARAELGMPSVRAALGDLASRCGPDPVPDLGPGVVVDQLTVLVWDAYAAGRGDGIPALLADLRRVLS